MQLLFECAAMGTIQKENPFFCCKLFHRYISAYDWQEIHLTTTINVNSSQLTIFHINTIVWSTSETSREISAKGPKIFNIRHVIMVNGNHTLTHTFTKMKHLLMKCHLNYPNSFTLFLVFSLSLSLYLFLSLSAQTQYVEMRCVCLSFSECVCEQACVRACVLVWCFAFPLCMGLYQVNIYNPINAKNPKNRGNTHRVCVCEIQEEI